MEDLKNKTSSSTVLDLESTFQSAPVGMSPVHTYVNSQNLPDISTEWGAQIVPVFVFGMVYLL